MGKWSAQKFGASLNWVGKRGGNVQIETASHPIGNGLEVGKIAEAPGAATSGLNEAVYGFDGCRGYPMGKESQDAIPMRLDRRG